MSECQARRLASQEFYCRSCGLRWDADDPDRPPCRKDAPKPVQVTSLRGTAIMGGQPVVRGSLVDRLAALCENMRAGVVSLGEAADMLEDLAVEVGVRTSAVDAAPR